MWRKHLLRNDKYLRHENAPWHTNIELVFATGNGVAYAYHNDYKAEYFGDEKHTNAIVEIVKDGFLYSYQEDNVDISTKTGLHRWAKKHILELFGC